VHARTLLIGASEWVFSSPRLRLIPYDFVDGSGDPEPRQIDLLALTGGTTELLLDGVTLTAGDYSWIRLKVNADAMDFVGEALVTITAGKTTTQDFQIPAP